MIVDILGTNNYIFIHLLIFWVITIEKKCKGNILNKARSSLWISACCKDQRIHSLKDFDQNNTRIFQGINYKILLFPFDLNILCTVILLNLCVIEYTYTYDTHYIIYTYTYTHNVIYFKWAHMFAWLFLFSCFLFSSTINNKPRSRSPTEEKLYLYKFRKLLYTKHKPTYMFTCKCTFRQQFLIYACFIKDSNVLFFVTRSI